MCTLFAINHELTALTWRNTINIYRSIIYKLHIEHGKVSPIDKEWATLAWWPAVSQSVRRPTEALIWASWPWTAVHACRCLGHLVVAWLLLFQSICRTDSASAALARQRLDDRQLILTMPSAIKSAHGQKIKGYARTQMHAPTALIKEQPPQLASSGGKKEKSRSGLLGKLIIHSVPVPAFLMWGICNGLCLMPGAKWNVSSLLFNQHSCHFHTSRSRCANSKHSCRPRPRRRCGSQWSWVWRRGGSPAGALSFNGFKLDLLVLPDV